jgi:uncharacterized protein CbrC (UPF0167 family)
MIVFRYFLGPRSEMAHLAREPKQCAFCGQLGDGFDLESALCPTLSEEEREGKYGCRACLAAGRFAFEHNTDIGSLDADGLHKEFPNQHDAPADLRSDALATLLQTPDVMRWQYEPWLTHCGDFMAYIGTWQPSEFVLHAPDGDGRAQFMKMPRQPNLWVSHAGSGRSPRLW